MTFDPHASVYAAGLAVGQQNIRDDTMTFRYEDETYTIPTIKIPNVSSLWNGYFYHIPIHTLRELAREVE